MFEFWCWVVEYAGGRGDVDVLSFPASTPPKMQATVVRDLVQWF